MGKPAEKWLTERQHQIELASADSSLVISQFNGAFSAASTLQEQTLRAERQ